MMGMQEELYSINSKENIRILKEAEYLEKIKMLENQKRQLINKIEDTGSRIHSQNQSIRELEQIILEQQSNINIAVNNEKKYEEIIKSFKNV